MQEYVDNIKTYSNKLVSIGFSMDDKWLGAILLAGLTDDFQPFIMGIEASGQSVSSDHIISKLLDSKAGSQCQNEALLAKNKFRKRNNNKKGKNKKKCYNCGSEEHFKNQCDQQKGENSESHEEAKGAFCDWYVDSGASSHMRPK